LQVLAAAEYYVHLVLMTDPHPVFCWNTSQLACPRLFSCSSDDSTFALIIGAFPLFTAPRLRALFFLKKKISNECWCSCAGSSGRTRLAQMWTGLAIGDPSVEQGCVQVLSTRILLQTPLHVVLPSTMFVAVVAPHRLFGNAV
jgi:hypothetical protein